MLSADSKGEPPARVARGVYVKLTTVRAVAFATLVVAPWLVIGGAAISRRPAPRGGQVPLPLTTNPVTQLASPGPWGELEITPIGIEPPVEFVTRFAAQFDSSTWYFRDSTPAKVGEALKAAGLSDEQRYALMQGATAEPELDGVSVHPTTELIFGLTPDVRSAVYELLWPEHKNLQAEPFRRRADSPEPWFAESGLGDETIAIARKLLYRRGPMECFADVSAMLTVIRGDADRAKLFRALSRQSSLLVKLRVRPDADLAALTAYWGRNGRDREVGPMLAALARLPGGGDVGVTSLLPAFARARYHTYPEPVGSTINGTQDCHFTSLNFWNDAPDKHFIAPEAVAETLLAAYRQIDKPTQLGDIVLFVDKNRQGFHSAVYIADDIFYTKNGSNIAAPWQLMRLADMRAYYDTFGIVKTMSFRKNGL